MPRPSERPDQQAEREVPSGLRRDALLGGARGLPHRRRRLRREAVVEEDGRDLGHLLGGPARLLPARRLDLDPDERAALRDASTSTRSSSSCGRLVETEVPDRRLGHRAAVEQLGRRLGRLRELRVAARRLALADEHDRGVGAVGRVDEERDGEADEEADRGADQRDGGPGEPSAAAHRGYERSFRAGKRITSRIVSRPVSSIASRSIPRPRPPVGGIP